MRVFDWRYGVAVLGLATACDPVDCGPGTHLEGSSCVVDDGSETGDTSGDSGVADSGEDDPTLPDTGPCAPPDAWAAGPVSPSLLTHSAYEASYDAGLAGLSGRASGYGSGTWSDANIISGATVVAVGRDSRWEYISRYYVADANSTYAVNVQAEAEIGDKVTFAVTGYEGQYGLPILDEIGSFSVSSSGNPVYALHLGAETSTFDSRVSQLTHEAGELVEASGLDCGTGYTCIVFEHDGVRDRIRVPSINSFGLDVDYDGGLCAEVLAPAGQYWNSYGLQGYFIDVAEPEWMRVWPRP